MQLKWDDSLEIGVDKIDNQHKELLERINKFFKTIDEGITKEEAVKTLEFLENYTKEHFKDEEELQKKYKYPKYNLQYEEHQDFINQLDTIRYALVRHELSDRLINQMQLKITDYWKNHVMCLDRELGEYVKSKTNM